MAETRKIDSKAVVSPKMFAHFVIQTNKYDEVINWYKTVLGAEVIHGGDGMTFLTYDDEHHRMAIVNSPNAASKDQTERVGLHHVAYTLGDLSELLGTYQRLKVEGIEPFLCINHGPTTSMYFPDPDGHGVELQVDNYETSEECLAWMRSDKFEENPFGILFDPDLMCQKYEAGIPLKDLLEQGSAPVEG